MRLAFAGSPEGTFNDGAMIVGGPISESASLVGSTPDSGILLSLVNKYLNTSNYNLGLHDSFLYGSPQDNPATASFDLWANYSAVTTVPEPKPVLTYVAALSVLCIRCGARLWRSFAMR